MKKIILFLTALYSIMLFTSCSKPKKEDEPTPIDTTKIKFVFYKSKTQAEYAAINPKIKERLTWQYPDLSYDHVKIYNPSNYKDTAYYKPSINPMDGFQNGEYFYGKVDQVYTCNFNTEMDSILVYNYKNVVIEKVRSIDIPDDINKLYTGVSRIWIFAVEYVDDTYVFSYSLSSN